MLTGLATITEDSKIAATAPAAPQAPPIAPASWPLYRPPVDFVIPANPIQAPPPDGQTLGKGGTRFGLIPTVYTTPKPPTFTEPAPVQTGPVTQEQPVEYAPPPAQQYDPSFTVPPQPAPAPRTGAASNVLPPPAVVPDPTPVAATRTSVPAPNGPPAASTMLGPIDLHTIPGWAWLVLIVVGAKAFAT